MTKSTNPKLYNVIGYGMIKEKDEWHQLQNDLTIACPDGINPYELVCSQLKEVFAYWLITLKEIKRS